MYGDHPPRPRLALNVAITGHRSTRLPADAVPRLRPFVDEVFARLRAATEQLHREEPVIFAPDPPQLRLHTPLATGADQVAATSAQAAGYRVRALLPFAPDDYRLDFTEGPERSEYERQLAAAEAIFALPCDRGDGENAYVMVGKAVVAAADVLVAIWDGYEESGPGGTAHVVDLALRAGVPVIHIAVDRDSGAVGPIRLLTGGDAFEPVAEPIEGADTYLNLVRVTLTLQTPGEREPLALYYAERERLSNWRLEYPLLLALLGVRRIRARPWRQGSVAENAARERQGSGSDHAFPRLERAYGWANFVAIRYAQLFRSGHVTNYALAALAVLLALAGLLIPLAKPLLVIAELATIGLIYLNTRAGTRGDWHRRWLQYRHLAESLRPLVYLKQTGMAAPPFRRDLLDAQGSRATGADWTRWYAAAVWRELDSPTGVITRDRIRELATSAVQEQIEPQAHYHRENAERMAELDHRLHRIGNLLMGVVIAACLAFLVGYVFAHRWTEANAGLFVLLTAGLPAVGAAVFGMRGHGEHLLTASRSASTVTALEGNAERLRDVSRLDTLVTELESAAANMLDDLNEWTLAYRERSLQVPA